MARERMFGWFDPVPLLRTGIDVVVSSLFGRYADERRMQALARAPIAIHDYRNATTCDERGSPRLKADGALAADGAPRDEMWITYVSDTGDGWNSTYGVAHHAAHPVAPAQRGEVLMLGGDEVYPVASRNGYQRKLVVPFTAALPDGGSPAPHVYALPGNHDWYDNLVAFEGVFCARDWFGGWYTPQSRSYFALQLPHRWWLIAVDLQLCSDIDKAQLDYFRGVAATMQEGDAIILCLPEPHWIYEELLDGYEKQFAQTSLAYLEQRVFGSRRAEVRVMLAGDLHHYRRHERERDRAQRITCGGGGAFLHPTHAGWLGREPTEVKEARLPDASGAAVPPSRAEERFALKRAYPQPAASSRHTLGNLAFIYHNPFFGLVPATLYLALCWLVQAPIGGESHLGAALGTAAVSAITQPIATLVIVAAGLGIVFFADPQPRWFRAVGGVAHAAAHLFAAFLLGWCSARVLGIHGSLYDWIDGQTAWRALTSLMAAIAIVFVGGWVVGSCIMGLYLLVSLNIFGCHANEAFSALRSPDWKSWLHLHIDRQGRLAIHPYGMRCAPRHWRENPNTQRGAPRWVPKGDAAIEQPTPIEAPIVIPGPATPGSAT